MSDLALEQIRQELLSKSPAVRKRPPKKPPRQLIPLSLERKYAQQIWLMFKPLLDSMNELLIPRLTDILRQAMAEVVTDSDTEERVDAWPSDVANVIGLISAATGVVDPGGVAGQVAFAAANFNKGQIDKIMRSVIGVDIFTSEPWLQSEAESFADSNAALIQKLEAETIDEISRITQEGVRQGRRVEDISADLRHQFKLTRNRANLIARDQVSKLNGSITRKRQESIGIDTYIWRTAMDERVRKPKHTSMEGKLCKWSDRTVYSKDGGKTWIPRRADMVHLHPGEDYQCRCYAEPNLAPLLDEANKSIDEAA